MTAAPPVQAPRRLRRRQQPPSHQGAPGCLDLLDHQRTVRTTPSNQSRRAPVIDRCLGVQEATGVNAESAFAVQGETGEHTALDAMETVGKRSVVNPPEASKGIVVVPDRWVVTRSFAWV